MTRIRFEDRWGQNPNRFVPESSKPIGLKDRRSVWDSVIGLQPHHSSKDRLYLLRVDWWPIADRLWCELKPLATTEMSRQGLAADGGYRSIVSRRWTLVAYVQKEISERWEETAEAPLRTTDRRIRLPDRAGYDGLKPGRDVHDRTRSVSITRTYGSWWCPWLCVSLDTLASQSEGNS